MTLLDNHLEQISLSSAAIAELPFPPPKIFTNAVLHSHDITALIRDTESHEQALFMLAAAEEGSRPLSAKIARRTTVYGLNGNSDSFKPPGNLPRGQGHRSAVATLLGGDLGEQIAKQALKESKDRGEPDVNALLKGAERLCGIYPILGAPEKIASLRSRHEQLNSSIAHYEAREAKQMAQLAKMSKQRNGGGDFVDSEDDIDASDLDDGAEEPDQFQPVTEEDLKHEEEEIRALEDKKRVLEERVSGMERDLGGLLR